MDVLSTSCVPSVPYEIVTWRFAVLVIEPHHSTRSHAPRAYLYSSAVPSRIGTVTSQMPSPWSSIASAAGFHGPSASMLPGR